MNAHLPSSEPTATLPVGAYAFLSIEFPELEALLAQESYQQQELYSQWSQMLLARCQTVQGHVERLHQSTAFVSFVKESTSIDSIEQGLRLVSSLAQYPLVIAGRPLVYRAGMAMVTSGVGSDPLLTVTERSLAPPFGVVLHPGVVQHLGLRRYPIQPLASWSQASNWEPGKSAPADMGLLLFQPVYDSALQGQADAGYEAHEEEQSTGLDEFLTRAVPSSGHNAPSAERVQSALETLEDGFDSFQVAGFSDSEGRSAKPKEPIPVSPSAVVGTVADVKVQFQQLIESELDTSVPVTPDAEITQNLNTANLVSPHSLPHSVQQHYHAPSSSFLSQIPYTSSHGSLLPLRVQPNQDYLQQVLTHNWSVPEIPILPAFFVENPQQEQANTTYKGAVEALTQAIQSFCMPYEEEEGRCCILTSESGFGKSTILQMVRMNLEPPAQPEHEPIDPPFIWLTGYAWQAKTPYPMQLWVDLFRNLFGFPVDGLQKEACYQHLKQMLTHVYGDPVPEESLAFFSRLMALAPTEPLQEGFEQNLGYGVPFLLDWFHRAAQIKPLVLVLEDIDEADSASLHWLQALLSKGLLRHRKLFLILTHRRQVLLEPKQWPFSSMLAKPEHLIALQLVPFSKDQLLSFLNEGPMNGQTYRYPDPLLDQLHQRSQGLPLWVEEYVRYLTLKGLLHFDPGPQALVPKDVDSLKIAELPTHLDVVLEQRSFTLDESHRYLLQAASILGERFSMEALASLSQLSIESLQQSLQHLWEQGWVMPDVGGGVAFRHRQLWDYWYRHTPQGTKLKLHQAMAQFYQDQVAHHQVGIHPSRVAWHAIQGEALELAFHQLNMAGVWAAHLGNTFGSLQAFKAAFSYLPNVPAPLQMETLYQLQETLALLTLEVIPRYSEEVLLWCCSQAHQQEHAIKVFYCLNLLSSAMEVQGYYAEALGPIDSCLTMAVPQTEPLDYAVLLTTKLDYLMKMERLPQAWELLQAELLPHVGSGQLLEHHQAGEKALLMVERLKGQLEWNQLHPKASRATLEGALAHARRLDLVLPQVAIQFAWTQTALGMGQYKLVQQLLNHGLALLQTQRHVEPYYARWGLLAAQAHLVQGDAHQAELLLANSLEQASHAQDPEVVLRLQYEQLEQAFLEGQAAGKLPTWQELRQEAKRCSLLGLEAQLLAWGAKAMAQQHAWQEGYSLLQEALVLITEPQHAHPYLKLCLEVQMASLQLQANWLEDGGHLLQRLWPEVTQAGLPPMMAETASLIALLYKKQSALHQQAALVHNAQAKSQAFAQRALHFWERLNNPYQQQRVYHLLEGPSAGG